MPPCSRDTSQPIQEVRAPRRQSLVNDLPVLSRMHRKQPLGCIVISYPNGISVKVHRSVGRCNRCCHGVRDAAAIAVWGERGTNGIALARGLRVMGATLGLRITMNKLRRRFAWLNVLCAVALAGCSPTQPFFLHEDGDLSHYLNEATEINYPIMGR